jgi:SNF family Na+-dependent transporter
MVLSIIKTTEASAALLVVSHGSSPSAATAQRTITEAVAMVTGALASSVFFGPILATILTSSSSLSTTDLRAVTADTGQGRTATTGSDHSAIALISVAASPQLGTAVLSIIKTTEASAAHLVVQFICVLLAATARQVSNATATTVGLVASSLRQSFVSLPDGSDSVKSGVAGELMIQV